MTVATSNLKKPEKKAVLENVLTLNGTVLDTWKPDCTTLVVKEIMLTPKVLTCIIWGTPIVTPKYFADFVKHVTEKRAPPDRKNYAPPCGEAVLPQKSVNLDYDPTRKNLFANKIFVFSNKAIWTQMTDLIQAAAGKAILFDDENVTVDTIKNSTEEYLFLNDGDTFEKNEKIQSILSYLKSLNQRAIPLQEIAIAIVKNSCSKDCNPSFNRVANLVEKADKTFSCGEALVINTQSQASGSDVKKEEEAVVIPPSYENPISWSCIINTETGVKREGDEVKRCDIGTKVSKRNGAGDVHQNTSKKLTQSPISRFITTKSTLSEAGTSKRTENNQEDCNPYKRKLKDTEKRVNNSKNNEVVEVSDGEEENIFKRPKIEKTEVNKFDESNKSLTETNKVASSTIICQNSGMPSFYHLDMSAIKPEKVSDSNRPSIDVAVKKENKSERSSIVSSISKEDLNPELEEFVNSFKNASIVQVNNCLPPKKMRSDNSIPSYSTVGVKNFKKFRKVSLFAFYKNSCFQ